MRIAKIVRGLRTFARDGATTDWEHADLRGIVTQVLDLCQQKLKHSSVHLEFQRPELAVMVKCQPVQVGQVLVNLMNNAIDAITGTASPWIRISVESLDEAAVIRVTDSGPALTEDVRRKIFEPFFTTKPAGKGTGMGLSISRAIVENHGGELFLDPTSKSTSFVLRLPRQAQHATSSGSESPRPN